MNFFKKNYNKPGPGVPKNAPKKKGFARFFEILGRDFGDLIKLNLWVEFCCLPAQALLMASVLSSVFVPGPLMLVFAILALAACVLVGPALTAQSLIITKRLRDDPGFVWEDFKKAFKENFKSLIVPSIIYGAIIGAQVYTIFLVLFSETSLGIIPIALFLLSSILFGMATPYFFVQKAYLDLGTKNLFKNSIFLAIGNFPKSFVYLLLHFILSGQPIFIICCILPYLFPIYLIYLLFLAHFLPNLAGYMWVWPIVDKTFKVDVTLKEREDDKLKDIESEIQKSENSQ